MKSRRNVIEVNSTAYIDYTYHRHSAPKNIVYYRCSDKRCKARLHYNLITKQSTLKNQHLDPEIHKKPKLSRVISLDSLPQVEATPKHVRHLPKPGLVRDSGKDESLVCLERLPEVPEVRYPSIHKRMILRLCGTDQKKAKMICREALKRGIAVQTAWTAQMESYSLEGRGVKRTVSGAIIDLEVDFLCLKEAKAFAIQMSPEAATISVFAKV